MSVIKDLMVMVTEVRANFEHVVDAERMPTLVAKMYVRKTS